MGSFDDTVAYRCPLFVEPCQTWARWRVIEDARNGMYDQHISPIEQRLVCWADIRGLQRIYIHGLVQKCVLAGGGRETGKPQITKPLPKDSHRCRC